MKSNPHLDRKEVPLLQAWVCNHFKDCLYYARHFKIFTDNNPVTYNTTAVRLRSTGLRSVNELAEFNLTIYSSPGKQNVIADTLSTPSANTDVKCMEASTKHILSDQLKAILDAAESQKQQSDMVSLFEHSNGWRTTKDPIGSLTTPTKCFNIDGLKKGQQSKH